MSRRRRRARGSRGALAAGAIAVVALAAAGAFASGVITIDRRSGTAPRPLADTSAGALDRAAAARADSASGRAPGALPGGAATIPLPPVAMAPADSATAARADSARPAPEDSLATGHGEGLVPPPRAGAAAAVATAAELAALGARMVVPVAGVAREELVNSYDDARGAADAGARRHDALDILAPRGTPVLAASAGRVIKLFDSERGGLTVYTLDEGGKFVLLYAHLDRYAPGIREGKSVKQGEMIGYVGTTGNANPATPHLHFAVARSADPRQWWQGTPVNPYRLLRGQGGR